MTQPSRTWSEEIPIVLLRQSELKGEVVYLGHAISLVRYEADGKEHLEFFENDEFVLLENFILQYEEWD